MSAEPRWNDDFRDLVDELLSAHAEFLIVGAHALAAHGLVRATGDLDVLVRPTAENAARVLEALRRFGAPVDAHQLTAADLEHLGTVYQMGLPPRRIDVITEISGVTFDEAWQTRVEVDLDGRRVSFLGREALITNKRAAGRDKDLADVRALEKGPK